MAAVSSSETFAPYQVMWRHNPEDCDVNLLQRENLTFRGEKTIGKVQKMRHNAMTSSPVFINEMLKQT
jgi:hypothetical protein